MHPICISGARGDGIGVGRVVSEISRRLEPRYAVGCVVVHGATDSVHDESVGVDARWIHVVAELHEDGAISPYVSALRGGDHHGSAAVHDRSSRALRCAFSNVFAAAAAAVEEED